MSLVNEMHALWKSSEASGGRRTVAAHVHQTCYATLLNWSL